MSIHDANSDKQFTAAELRVLKLFYQGVRARQLRETYWWIDPWQVVQKHRGLPREQYEVIKHHVET